QADLSGQNRQARPRYQQREQRQARDRVQHAREPGDRPVQQWQLADGDAQDRGQDEADHDGDGGELQVLAYPPPAPPPAIDPPLPMPPHPAGQAAGRGPRRPPLGCGRGWGGGTPPPAAPGASPRASFPRSPPPPAVWTADASSIESASRRVVSNVTIGEDGSTSSVSR